jgi:hypothetical protein
VTQTIRRFVLTTFRGIGIMRGVPTEEGGMATPPALMIVGDTSDGHP